MRSKNIMTTGNFPWTVFLSATFYLLAIYVSALCSIRKLQFGKMNAWELHLALIQTWFYTWKCRQIYQVRANEYHYQNNKNYVQQLINCIFHFYKNTALPLKMLVVSGQDQWEWFLNFGFLSSRTCELFQCVCASERLWLHPALLLGAC